MKRHTNDNEKVSYIVYSLFCPISKTYKYIGYTSYINPKLFTYTDEFKKIHSLFGFSPPKPINDVLADALNAALKKRLDKHRGSPTNALMYEWIDTLSQNNSIPEIEALDYCEKENVKEMESYWINQFNTWGFNLLNITPKTKLVNATKREELKIIDESEMAEAKKYKITREQEYQEKLNKMGEFERQTQSWTGKIIQGW